jgi:hypothetical protein
MLLIRTPVVRSLAAAGLLALSAAACRVTDAADPGAARAEAERRNAVAGVGITLGFPGSVSDAFLTRGDRDTVRALAFTGGWPSYAKYDSEREPRRFAYRSGNPAVATVDADGVVTAVGVGTAFLSATCEGVESGLLALTIAPPARELRATPAALEVAVGDTLTVTVTAVDERGAGVAGVVFNVAPDTSYWAVVAPPIEGSWRLETPRTLRLLAKTEGRVRLRAYSQNERPDRRLEATPVAITVRTR